MRTPGDFKTLKQAVIDGVTSHPLIRALLEADPFRGKMPNPAKLEIHCHWDQSLSLVLTESLVANNLVGPNHLKRIIAEIVPSARVYGAENKRAMSLTVNRTVVHFSIPEDAQAANQAVPPASNF